MTHQAEQRRRGAKTSVSLDASASVLQQAGCPPNRLFRSALEEVVSQAFGSSSPRGLVCALLAPYAVRTASGPRCFPNRLCAGLAISHLNRVFKSCVKGGKHLEGSTATTVRPKDSKRRLSKLKYLDDWYLSFGIGWCVVARFYHQTVLSICFVSGRELSLRN